MAVRLAVFGPWRTETFPNVTTKKKKKEKKLFLANIYSSDLQAQASCARAGTMHPHSHTCAFTVPY
jgi:hypothetical protein